MQCLQVIHGAAESEHLDMIKLLIENGADVNAAKGNGDAMIHNAAQKGNIELLKLLLDTQGIQVRQSLLAHPNLHLVSYCKPRSGEAAYPNLRFVLYRRPRSGETASFVPLHQEGLLTLAHPSGLLTLLRTCHVLTMRCKACGVQVDAAGKESRTALMHAVRSNNQDAIMLLLRADADPAKQDSNGKSSIDYATTELVKDRLKLQLAARTFTFRDRYTIPVNWAEQGLGGAGGRVILAQVRLLKVAALYHLKLSNDKNNHYLVCRDLTVPCSFWHQSLTNVSFHPKQTATFSECSGHQARRPSGGHQVLRQPGWAAVHAQRAATLHNGGGPPARCGSGF